jgi:membrane associated rhomboid family serine protease
MVHSSHVPSERQPMFNIPTVVVATVGVLFLIHLIRTYALPPADDQWVVLAFAFIPARVTEATSLAGVLPGGDAARVWSFLTYAFLHGSWSHVGFNSLWLVAFGSPLAWRFGAGRFLLFSAAGAIGGALAQLGLHPGEVTPMVGASAAISAHMAPASSSPPADPSSDSRARATRPIASRRRRSRRSCATARC